MTRDNWRRLTAGQGIPKGGRPADAVRTIEARDMVTDRGRKPASVFVPTGAWNDFTRSGWRELKRRKREWR